MNYRRWWREPAGGQGFDDDLAGHILRLAKREGISLNRAALKLLRKGAGLTDASRSADFVGSSLDYLIGSWSSEEAAELDQALEDLEVIDEAAWGWESCWTPTLIQG